MKLNVYSRILLGLIVSVIGLTFVQGCNGPSSSTASESSVKVVTDAANYDFGMMEQDADGTHDFLVRNAGPETIVLQAGKASCSVCTSFTIEGESEKTLEPGDEATITVDWTTEGKLGEFSVDMPLLVESETVLTLSVVGDVSPMLSIMPSKTWDLGDYRGDEPLGGKGALVSHILTNFEITGIETSSKYLTVTSSGLSRESKKNSHNAKSGYQLAVLIDPDIPFGVFHGTVTIKTDADGHEAKFNVTCERTATVKMFGPKSFDVEKLTWIAGRLKAGDVKNAELQLFLPGPEDGGESTFEVDSNDKSVTVVVEPDLAFQGKKSRRFVLKVGVDTNKAAGNGLVRAVVLIKTNDESVGTIKLSVKYNVISGG